MIRTLWLTAALSVACFASPVFAATEETEEDDSLRWLAQHDHATDTTSLLTFLQRLMPQHAAGKAVDALIGQLGADRFADREDASHQLAAIGIAARPKLERARKSQDKEVAYRADMLLNHMQSRSAVERRDRHVAAALRVLRQRGDSRAVTPLLELMEVLSDSYLRDAASEALWASVKESHGAWLREQLQNTAGEPTCAAAIVALELAQGESAVPMLRTFLESPRPSLRLAASRALIDHMPKQVAGVLAELVGGDDVILSLKAETLLDALTGLRFAESKSLTAAAQWNKWVEHGMRGAEFRRLGAIRLDLHRGRNLLVETFVREEQDVTNGYGSFTFESTVRGQASVRDGVLRIDGDHDEGDQRLVIGSRRLIGRGEWPDQLEVQVALKGEDAGSGGWHMGVSIGGIKAIFHPSYAGGGFRFESVKDHAYLTQNENMGFTPTAAAMHRMTVRAQRNKEGMQLVVRIEQGDGQAIFTRSLQIDRPRMGTFDRIGLERSGRRGGAALFDSVSIRLGQ